MKINFGLTPDANQAALITAQNPRLVFADVSVSEPSVIDEGIRNTSVQLTGTGTGVYAADQSAVVKYTRRDVAGEDITKVDREVVLAANLEGDAAGIEAAVLAEILVDQASAAYVTATYDAETGTVTIAPTVDAAVCLIGTVVVEVLFEDPAAVLADDVNVTDLDGFSAE